MQFYNLSDQWNTEQRDCAGLVRFAWREALRKHDRAWFQRMGENYDPDRCRRPSAQHRGARRKTLSHHARKLHSRDVAEGKFSEFADAQTLKMFNATFVGRDRGNRPNPAICFSFINRGSRSFPFT